MITKITDIKVDDLANYLRLTEWNTEKKYLETILNSAKNYITNYTGIKNLDEYSDLIPVVFVLCQDMYDNRSYYVDNHNVNLVIQSTLDMHSVNLIA